MLESTNCTYASSPGKLVAGLGWLGGCGGVAAAGQARAGGARRMPWSSAAAAGYAVAKEVEGRCGTGWSVAVTSTVTIHRRPLGG